MNFLGSTQLSFGESLSTLPASVNDFKQIFSANDLTYQFENHSTIISSTTTDKQINIHYKFSLRLIPFYDSNPDSPANSMLPMTMLHSDNFNKASSIVEIPKIAIEEEINEKLTDVEKMPQIDSTNAVPKTFAYTLSLLDCSFNKRPFVGIWQLR